MDNILDSEIGSGAEPARITAEAGQRIIAMMVDAGVVAAVIAVAYFAMKYNHNGILALTFRPCVYAALLLYKPASEYWHGATIGKKVAKIEVVKTSHVAISVKDAIMRNVLAIMFTGSVLVAVVLTSLTHRTESSPGPGNSNAVDFVIGLVFILTVLGTAVDLAVMIFDDQHRSLQDRLGNSLVVKATSH